MFNQKKKTTRQLSPELRPAKDQGPAAKRQPTGETPSASAQPKAMAGRKTTPTPSSTLNSHLVFDGNLQFAGTLSVDCEFRGSIVTEDTLLVGVSGRVHAEVTAGVVEVSGKVHGDIKARTSVKILTGGEVYGNIETPTIAMEEGVVFEGNCTRPAATESHRHANVRESSQASDPGTARRRVESVVQSPSSVPKSSVQV